MLDNEPMSGSRSSDRHVVLLRAVNVGAHNRISMASLRELLEGLGYERVRTHLQSGNAVLSADMRPEQVQAEVEQALAQAGTEVRVMVRDELELERVIAENPFAGLIEDPARMLVAFLHGAPDPERVRELAPADFEPDRFAIGEREVYALYEHGMGRTRLSNAFWERQLGVVATGRNWNTVTRLLELARDR